jgi:hypothetical protein
MTGGQLDRHPVGRKEKNPLVACLGRARVDNQWATVSPYSPCCFQEYLPNKTHAGEKVSLCHENFFAIDQ